MKIEIACPHCNLSQAVYQDNLQGQWEMQRCAHCGKLFWSEGRLKVSSYKVAPDAEPAVCSSGAIGHSTKRGSLEETE